MDDEHYKCCQCDDEWNAPSHNCTQWWSELADKLGGFVVWSEALSWLDKNTNYDERVRKVITLHLSLVENKCHYCDDDLSQRGVVYCTSCLSLNYNFVKGNSKKLS